MSLRRANAPGLSSSVRPVSRARSWKKVEFDTTPSLSSSSAICSRLDPRGTTTQLLAALVRERLEERHEEPGHTRDRDHGHEQGDDAAPARTRATAGRGGQLLRLPEPVPVR